VDLELPDTNGLAILEELNRQEHDIPTIMMTGYGSEGVAARALRLGVQGYLIKPFTTEEVLSSIDKALSVGRLHREKEQLAALLDRYMRHLRMLSAVSRSMVMGMALGPFLERVVEAGLFMTQGDEGALLLWDRESNQLRVAAVQGRSSYNCGCCSSLAGDARLRATLEEARVVRIHASPDSKLELQTGENVHAILQAPLMVRSHVLGMLSLVRRRRSTPFGKHDEQMAILLAHYAALALDRDSDAEAKAAIPEAGILAAFERGRGASGATE
jgi:transcriptional regulator with GAF, ATPase, and Fis domain